MSKILKKASSSFSVENANKYSSYQLSENPFPTMASVNESSPEKKYNGSIYEESIREEEYKKLASNFLEVAQSNPDHLRLGFLSDTSYIGRGNGKTSFLVNLMRLINKDYSLDLSHDSNKCFSIYFSPDGGGSVKTFERFVDYFFNALIKSNIISECLAILRYEAIDKLGWQDFNAEEHFSSDEDIVVKLTDDEWFKNNIPYYKREITEKILENSNLSSLPADFPLLKDLTILTKLISQKDFENYFKSIRNEKLKLEFVFTHLVNFFIAAGFNGSYVLIDDFERIPDFQSAMQKKDFAIQLRTVLFDGSYQNSRIGFYNFIIALHAGVPRLIQEAWSLAGMEQRVSISGNGQARHIINFEKITDKHAIKLVKKYLNEYREGVYEGDDLYPFNSKSITIIANNSEMNISRILQNANNLVEFGINSNAAEIDEELVAAFFSKERQVEPEEAVKSISSTPSLNLADKVKQQK
ncbi:hypothetical protein [Mucilaginibacter sp. PAMB04168]|uniref:hypothetical protein n=1 Tax=Mucilaginibacter sp. PAMB04168 TaxID=3138567 RepID=UPI0031F706BD